MNYKLIIAICSLTLLAASCERKLEMDSVPSPTSIPFVETDFTDGSYGFGLGSNMIYPSIPEKIGVVVDSVVGFSDGFGGKTGHDTAYILKSDLKGGEWPDTTKLGGNSLVFEKYNNSGFKAAITVNIVIAEPIKAPSAPGPTNLAGTYMRTSNSYLIDIIKIFDGVYLIANPGGAGVAPYPYVLKNFKNEAGKDSLSFEIQVNPCAGGLQLVGPAAPLSLTSAEYTATYPPAITSLSPLTFSWRVFEFPDADPSSGHTGVALCQWGTGVRTFIKQ